MSEYRKKLIEVALPLTSHNAPEKFYLALMIVGESGASPIRYLVGYAFRKPVFVETAATFRLRKLLPAGEPT